MGDFSKIMQLAPIIWQAIFPMLVLQQWPDRHMLLGGSRVLAPHKASTDTFLDGRGRHPHYCSTCGLITAGCGESPEALLGLPRQQSPIWEGKRGLVTAMWQQKSRLLMCPTGLCHSWLMGMKIPASYLSFSEATFAGVLGALVQPSRRVKSRFPITTLLHGWELGHIFFCGFWLE